MPSPLPKSISNYIVQIGTVHNDRQLLAIHAGRVVATWATLEVTMSMLFNAMLKGDPIPAAAIFNSIRSENGQRDAFRALSAVTIPDPEDRDILEAILASVRGLSP
jgi:hypothetical protein